jgi:uncharacterized protein YdhG (YjbR/CyaY superfamily)
MTTKTESPTVSSYITSAPEATRPILRQLRQIITTIVPEAEETISYGMPFYAYFGRLVYFAAHKNHVGLYALGPVSQYPEALKRLTVGQGTIRLRVNEPVPVAAIENVVAACARRNRAAAVAS